MSNILNAVINLVNNPIVKIKEYGVSNNRATSQGKALEEYIKDLFAGTVGEKDISKRNKRISEVFSFLGSANNPPDSMLRGGDAIEVKKIETKGASLALNSSYPHQKLKSNSNMITKACRTCEDWTEKDVIYIVGVVKNNILSNLSMVYGLDYAANEDIYLRIKNPIVDSIYSTKDIEFSNTNELARVNAVDPLGVTYFRVRGMWGIKNPMKVFDYIYTIDDTKDFNAMILINNEKYDTFTNTDELESLVGIVDGLKIKDVEIQNPDNPAKLRNAKLITFNTNKE